MDAKQLITDHVVIQKLGYSCGPCTILNILRLKGDTSHDEMSLTGLCGAEPNVGTTNENLLKACRQVGLTTSEAKQNASPADVERHVTAGEYVIINYIHAYSGQGHYGLVTGYDDTSWYMLDSSFGIFRLRKEYLPGYWYNSDKSIPRWFAAVT